MIQLMPFRKCTSLKNDRCAARKAAHKSQLSAGSGRLGGKVEKNTARGERLGVKVEIKNENCHLFFKTALEPRLYFCRR